MSAESSSSSNDCSFVSVESSPSTAESSASFFEILSSTAKSSASFVNSSSSAAEPSPSSVELSSSTAESSNASGVGGEETENATSDEYIIPRRGLNNWMVLRKQLSSSSAFSEGYCVSESPDVFNVNIDLSASVSSDLDPDVTNQILNTNKVKNTGDDDEIFLTSTP